MLNQAAVLKVVVGIVALSPELELVVAVAGVAGVAGIQNGIDGVVVVQLPLTVCIDEVIVVIGMILSRIHCSW